MTQGWIVSHYLDCVEGIGLHCPKEVNLTRFEEAASEGWITWHAYPHNAQLSVMDRNMIEFGVQMVHDLDSRLKQNPKATLSQRDVPGLPRSVIPPLLDSGVTTISVGSNARINFPNVAPMTRWRDVENPKYKVPEELSGSDGVLRASE